MNNQNYSYPIDDTDFLLRSILKFDDFAASSGLEEVNVELILAILTEAAKLGETVLAPLNSVGDLNPPVLTEVGVQESPGFKEAYEQYAANGWPGLNASIEYGGQGLPNVVGMAVDEIINSSNLAFAVNPLLNSGAIQALSAHATEEQKQLWLTRLVSGEWCGTMNLTEPDAGTDLAAIKTTATPDGDAYRIRGQKIFISWGDHQLTENIVHLVLARLPDAPAGVKGISLFIVPKFLVDENGNIQNPNDLRAVGVEHKLGIHGSPTCIMSYGENEGAIGYLLGEPNNGLTCMFTMMNHARQAVGLQGLAISERAYQHARQYANERLQGTNRDGSRYSIIKFPDVRRMLMLMKSSTEAMRALAYTAAMEHDKASNTSDTGLAHKHEKRTSLYTPIVKGWLTEMAQEVVSLGVQIHGGMGFVEETGAAQFFRDARILPIYEGTNGIQGLDLIGRKTLADGGETYRDLLQEMEEVVASARQQEGLSALANDLQTAIDLTAETLQWILDNDPTEPDLANGSGFNFMMMTGFLCGGWLMLKSSLATSASDESDFNKAKQITSRFYFQHYMPRIGSYASIIRQGVASMMELDDGWF